MGGYLNSRCGSTGGSREGRDEGEEVMVVIHCNETERGQEEVKMLRMQAPKVCDSSIQ